MDKSIDVAPKVYLRRTYKRALDYVALTTLRTWATDLN